MTTENRITGLIDGSVTQRNRLSAPAPSSSADSYRCLGTSSSDARKMIIVLPIPHSASSTSAGFDQLRRVEPQRPLDPDLAEQRVHRAGGRVQQEHEAERGRHRRRERRQVEDRAEEADAAPRALERHRHADREQHLERHHDRDQPERVLHGRPDRRVLLEQELVVRGPDPARVRQQVVVGERQVRVADERIGEEHAEAHDPRAHEQQDEAPPPPGRPAPGAAALRCERHRVHRATGSAPG